MACKLADLFRESAVGRGVSQATQGLRKWWARESEANAWGWSLRDNAHNVEEVRRGMDVFRRKNSL